MDVDGNPLSVCEVHRVQDGDSLWLRCAGGLEQVRLYCIDAPELSQSSWGAASKRHVRWLLRGLSVRLERVDTDRYGRTVGRVWIDGDDLALALVEAGWAVVYPRYCPTAEPYYGAETRARDCSVGVWRAAGPQRRPWTWRAAEPG